jgi:hypothetical protein
MNKIYINESTYNYLDEWAEPFREQIKVCKPFFDEVTVFFVDKGLEEFEFNIHAKKDKYKFQMRYANKQCAKGSINKDITGLKDFMLYFSLADEVEKNEKEKNYVIHYMQVFATAFMEANAFLWYGNLIEERKIKANGRNIDNDKIIVFRPYKETLYAVPTSYHRSPEGIFQVRGHFRHYKDGKIVWIESYMKGVNDDDE